MSLFDIQNSQLSDEVWMVSLRGAVDASNVDAVRSAVREVMKSGGLHVLLDLKQAQFVSSTGFSAFLKIADEIDEKRGQIVFLATPPRIKEIFKLLGLDTALSFAPDAEAALAYLATLSSEPSSTPRSEKV